MGVVPRSQVILEGEVHKKSFETLFFRAFLKKLFFFYVENN